MSTMRLAHRPEEAPAATRENDAGSADVLPTIDLNEYLQILLRQKNGHHCDDRRDIVPGVCGYLLLDTSLYRFRFR